MLFSSFFEVHKQQFRRVVIVLRKEFYMKTNDKNEKYNRTYKSSVFISLFQTCDDAKKNALSLINAIHGTNITDESRIKHIDLETSIYNRMRNDVSFMLDDRLVVLVEHQSTINNNMPLRSLMYISRIYLVYCSSASG